MYQHLTETARQVVLLAQDFAQEKKLDYIDTAQVLGAIIQHRENTAARILLENNFSFDAIQQEIDRLARQALEQTWVFGRIPGSPHFKKVIIYALEEAEKNQQKKVGTEDILLGLLKEKDCAAQKILKHLGLTPAKITAYLEKQKNGSSSTS